MLQFLRRKVDVLNHWIGFVEGFHIPPRSFYSSLKDEIDRHQVPKITAIPQKKGVEG